MNDAQLREGGWVEIISDPETLSVHRCEWCGATEYTLFDDGTFARIFCNALGLVYCESCLETDYNLYIVSGWVAEECEQSICWRREGF